MRNVDGAEVPYKKVLGRWLPVPETCFFSPRIGPQLPPKIHRCTPDCGLGGLEAEEKMGERRFWPPTLAACWYRLTDNLDDLEYMIAVLTSTFGTYWRGTADEEKHSIVATEPRPIFPEWDALVAAWVEQKCSEYDVLAPDWVRKPNRFLEEFWNYIPQDDGPRARKSAFNLTSATFLAHGIVFSEEELMIV